MRTTRRQFLQLFLVWGVEAASQHSLRLLPPGISSKAIVKVHLSSPSLLPPSTKLKRLFTRRS